MATYFVSNGTIDGAPNDLNDGLDPLGIELSSAAYDDEGHVDGDYRIFSGSAFTDYTWASGDQIYLTGAVITDGLYEVASKIDDDRILLASSAGGDDTVDSSDGPWATIQHGMDTVTSGNELIICGSSTYSIAGPLDIDTQACDELVKIWYTGATARGVVDGTRATIDFSTGAGEGISYTGTVAAINCVFSNLVIQNATHNGVHIDSSAHWMFFNCRITGNGYDGVLLGSSAASMFMYGCEIDNNTLGIDVDGTSRGPMELFGCSIHDNSSHGVEWSQGGNIYSNCAVYGNGGSGFSRIAGISATYDAYITVWSNCTIATNTAAGIDFVDSSHGRNLIVASVLRDNGTYGVDCAGVASVALVQDCCIHGNDTAASDVTLPTGTGNIYVDPEFESEVDGSEDFEPDSDSPLIGAVGISWVGGGTQYLDIGAIQREMAVGGGGGTTVPQGIHPIGDGITA